jgi:hypothetical protein
MQVERRADADRDPVDTGDHWLLGGRQPDQKGDQLLSQRAALRIAEEIADVIAGRECAGHTEEDVHANRGIGLAGVQRFDHGGVHGASERVLLVRPVHADELGRAAALDGDVLGQVSLSSVSR